MADSFNTYIEHIEPEFWRELCMKEGKLLHFEKGEEFVSVGAVARYVGYIQSGSVKYIGYSEDGTEHVVGMHSDGEFIADFPWSLYGMKARVSIEAVKPCDILCLSVREIKRRMELEKDRLIPQRHAHTSEPPKKKF